MEDWARHKSDKEVNGSECYCLRNGKIFKYERDINFWGRYSWAEVEVGDLMVIHQDEMFPCDIVVLGSQIESGKGHKFKFN